MKQGVPMQSHADETQGKHRTGKRPIRFFVLAAGVGLVAAGPLVGQSLPPAHVDDFTGRPRVIVISDIGNEPDDQMSLVRLLLYSNELDLEAMIATTSTWQKTVVHPETMRALIAAYGQVRLMERRGRRRHNRRLQGAISSSAKMGITYVRSRMYIMYIDDTPMRCATGQASAYNVAQNGESERQDI